MKCPYCAGKSSRVTDKRETEDYISTRRRRECSKCKRRFTTYERVELGNLTVVKKNGKKEMYNRDKLRKGVLRALEKRDFDDEKVEKLMNQIEADVRSNDMNLVSSEVIGAAVMEKLKDLDHVAYIRFASVYRSFADVESFEEALKSLKQ
tara:strand:- start:1383 stop:1832 length:450 start_codon:yes stop_codon:yes gene_type:complete